MNSEARAFTEITGAQMVPMFALGAGVYARNLPLSSDEENFIKRAVMAKNTGNSVGTDFAVLESRELKSIKKFCLQAVDHYFSEFLRFKAQLRITVSWINKTEPGEYHHVHKHPNSVISGVFYLDDTAGAPIKFENPVEALNPYEIGIMDNNPYNSLGYQLICDRGNHCVLFPSFLKHEVQRNNGHKPRYSIAFNTFFKPGQKIGAAASRLHI